MNWAELLKTEIESTYAITTKLMDLVDDSALDWKPGTGANWMTTGQVLHHLTNGCGAGIKGFVTGDWGMPPDVDVSQLPPEDMLPPAEKLPAVTSVAEAKDLLASDKAIALAMVAQCSENDLTNKTANAPWDPRPLVLGHRILQMIDHLKQHKGQLFYYLKLQGKPVHTGNLWGM